MHTNEPDTGDGITLHVLSAVTDGAKGGNPAGVVPEVASRPRTGGRGVLRSARGITTAPDGRPR